MYTIKNNQISEQLFDWEENKNDILYLKPYIHIWSIDNHVYEKFYSFTYVMRCAIVTAQLKYKVFLLSNYALRNIQNFY